ncbi:hypothetical protein ACFQX6_52510 [Streptosporangium lutulentum]
MLVHASGALSTMVMSFDAVATVSANIEVHGERGSLIVPDPNRFSGEVKLFRLDGTGWETLPESARLPELLTRLRTGRHGRNARGPGAPCRGSLAFHVLDVMESLLLSTRTGRSVPIESTCQRPAPVPLG